MSMIYNPIKKRDGRPSRFCCFRGEGCINTSMTYYVVRGPNWKIDIKITEDFDSEDYAYVEAATQAIELIYSDEDTIILSDNGQSPKFTSVVQVAKHEHDVKIPIPEDEDTAELRDLAELNVVNGLIRFLATPLILANAGRYAQAEFLKGIIEND